MTVLRVMKKPIVVHAVEWDGNNVDELVNFTNGNFREVDSNWIEYRKRNEPEGSIDESKNYTAEVFDKYHDTWILLETSSYIMRGTQGENYPINKIAFQETYNVLGDETAAERELRAEG